MVNFFAFHYGAIRLRLRDGGRVFRKVRTRITKTRNREDAETFAEKVAAGLKRLVVTAAVAVDDENRRSRPFDSVFHRTAGKLDGPRLY